MKQNDNGFTLMELLIVIAIIAILVAIAIPAFAAQMEKVREAADLANVRSAYAQVSADAMLGNPDSTITVNLKQKQEDWQSMDPVNIGGIIHAKGQGDTENWIGVAAPGGTCVVSYKEGCGVVLTWSGKADPSGPNYPFNTAIKDYFGPLYDTKFWKDNKMKDNSNFEFDSRCPNSNYLPEIWNAVNLLDNSLLQQEGCTWAYLGDGHKDQQAKRYLFWTSLNTDTVGAGKKIPVIIQTGDRKYYVSETTTGQRSSNGELYVAVSERLTTNQYKDVLNKGTEYETLEKAYDAYLEALDRSGYKPQSKQP